MAKDGSATYSRPPTTPPRFSDSERFHISVACVVAMLALLTLLARAYREISIFRWVLDKVLRLGTALMAIESIPFLTLAGMADDDNSPQGAIAALVIILIIGALVLFLLWLATGYKPQRDSRTGSLYPLSAAALTALYVFSTAGWSLAGFWVLQRTLL